MQSSEPLQRPHKDRVSENELEEFDHAESQHEETEREADRTKDVHHPPPKKDA